MIPLPNYKEITDLIKKGATLEAQEKIIALREAAISIQEENIRLQQENADLKRKLATSEQLTFTAPFYYAKDDAVPFCPRCWEKDRQAIHLIETSCATGPVFTCHECKTRILPEPRHQLGRQTTATYDE